jgi:acyl-coenzyme A synthetase/AMP-(fatty) acid ligase
MSSLAPPPERFNIARYCLAGHAAERPEKTALIIAGAEGAARRWSYAEIEAMVRRLAGGLRALGLPRGARVMIRTDNDLPYILAFFGAMAAGCVPLPSSAALTGEEAEFLLGDSEAGAIVLSERLGLAHDVPSGVRVLDNAQIARLAETASPTDYADTAAEDPAFLIYTSGTVGRPKGVLHAHRSAWGRRPMYQGWYGIGADDIVLHAGAFNWTYTLGVGLVDPWANGATAVLYNGPADPAVWPKLIARFGVTIFATVPSLYRRILKYGELRPEALKTLRHGLSAGEALPPTVQDAWQAATGTPLYEALGMSEISTYISTGPGMVIKPGSPGRQQPGRRVAILDAEAADGEARLMPAGESGLLAVHRSDPGLMLGYWRRPEEEALVFRGEWFCGGDMAHLDDDGYVWFEGRHDDILNPGGYRLSPLEIEGVLAQHPMVQEAAVGELAVSPELKILAAFVVAEGLPDEATLLAWAGQHLASYKVPKRVVFVPQLPRNRAGKLLRRDLAANVEAIQSAQRMKA